MSFPWYEIIRSSDNVTQGDIIPNCHIPFPKIDVYHSIISGEEVPGAVRVETADVIVLSQACDIENDKINSIVLSPVWPLTDLMKINGHYNSSNGKESLRQGKEPAYHLLNEYFENEIEFPYHVVEFHRIFSLPKAYLKELVKGIETRLRLQPPYREHLSQAFARYFMRVGLPIDIDREKLKSLKN